ncbi:glutamine--fructose-6-phosphate transaminase (isomerizing), partial [bacterium]|nr:glutamine--fructose-6-phosphate transaminase (isomerizing) [bacterium]
MCGIVGYLGDKNTVDVLVGGLKRLEYRGYDSSGLAVFENKEFTVLRAQGKLSQLEDKIKNHKPIGKIGIAHTRWATHGVPSEKNAHPHKVDGVCLVHNGIIENYSELKQELVRDGAQFLSETDSEVVAHLIARELKTTPHLRQAVHKVLKRIEGAYAILVVWDQQPGTMVAFKNGPPLIVGVGQKEMFVGSDVQAMLQYTKSMVYLEDQEVAEMNSQGAQFYNLQGDPIQKSVTHIEWSSAQADKMGFKHYMLKEIFEQPKAVASVLEQYIDHQSLTVKFSDIDVAPMKSNDTKTLSVDDLKKMERIFIIACGTSYYASMYAEYLIEKLSGVAVEVDVASEFRYREPVIPKNSLVMVISQSGETADTLAVLRMAKDKGAMTLSLTNTKGSTIDRESHGHLYMHAGVEVGVASTKAFISTLTVVNLFAILLGRLRETISVADEKNYVQNLLALPSQMEAVLSYDKFFAKASSVFKAYRGFLYLGRGINYPIAMEGALKLKELAYMHAEGYAAGEMKHGPLALIDSSILVLVICPKDMHYEKTLSNLQEAKARGGVIVSIGTGEDKKLKEMSKEYLSLPKSDWMASGILSVIPVQLLAYHVANVMGYDVDQPRN